MKHPAVDAEHLAQKLRAVMDRGGMSLEQIASQAGVEQSRASRFRAGEFRRMTPTLEKFCRALGVRWRDYLCEDGPRKLPDDLLESVRRLVGKNPRKIRAVRQLVRSIETLAEERASVVSLTTGRRPAGQ